LDNEIVVCAKRASALALT